MATNVIPSYLKYANLQMAAEALLDQFAYSTPLGLKAALEFGNNRSSKFTTVLADQFVANGQGWVVVAHKANSPTGFSGTLFKYNGQSDPARGLISSELVLSFRSTEFIDDSVRDAQATGPLQAAWPNWAPPIAPCSMAARAPTC